MIPRLSDHGHEVDEPGLRESFKVLVAADLPDRKVALRRLRSHRHVYRFSPLSLIHQVKPVMSDVTIRVPQDIVQALRLPPDAIAVELQRELAVALYQRGILSSGKAAALAGMNRWEWEELLGARKISRHYTDEDLDRDKRLCARGY